MPSKLIMITASIVIHKTPEGLLQSLLDSLLPSEVEKIFILDNSPQPLYSEKDFVDRRITYRHIENHGFGAAHNIAIKQIMDYDGYHLVLNPDVRWKNEVITPMINYMNSSQDIGLMAPKVLNPDGTLQFSVRRLPTIIDLIAKRFLPSFLSKKRINRYLMKDINHEEVIEAPYLTGCFMLFRNSVLKEIGGFDERFFLYPEDIDISRRINEKHRVVYWPLVSITHDHQQESSKSLKMLCIHCVNMIRYFWKYK